MKLIRIITIVLSCVAVLTAGDLIDGTRKCAGTLYKELIRTEPNQNIFFSPLTLQIVMSMIASAAQNEDAAVIDEIRTALSLSYGEANREADFKNLLDELKSDNELQLFDATKMYFGIGYSIRPWYKQIVQNIYGAEFETVNFENTWNTTRKINEWVAKKTNQKIKNFLNQGDITSDTVNVLISTLYLSGKWDKPFSTINTISQNFYGVNIHGENETKTVLMMFNNNYTNGYYEDVDAQYLQLSLTRDEGDAEMVIVLPQKQRDLHNLEQNIPKLLSEVRFASTKVSVTLPKFSLRTEMKLKPTLQNIGIKRLFNSGAELTGLQNNGHLPVVVSDVIQKAIIDVDELGVTAASVTGGIVMDGPYNDPKTFTADRPFFFYITASQAVLFAGRVMQV